MRPRDGARELNTACYMLVPYASEAIDPPRRGLRGPLGKRRQALCQGRPGKETYSKVRPPQKAYWSHWSPNIRSERLGFKAVGFFYHRIYQVSLARVSRRKVKLAAQVTRPVPACELAR